MDIYLVTAGLVLLSALIVSYRVIQGPTLVDRLLAANFIGTKTIVLLALVGFAAGRPHFLDIALVYALISFVATVAALKFLLQPGADGGSTSTGGG